MTKCCLYGCARTGEVPLGGQPPHTTPDGIFWFCREHGEKYKARGYESVRVEREGTAA